MIRKSLIALAALGLVGAVSLTPTAPAEAFFLCAKDASAYKPGSWCARAAERRAKRRARWAAFWGKRKR